jgi:hypothetical protein
MPFRGKIIISELKFQVAGKKKDFSRSKIIMSDLTFQVVVIKTIFPKENNNFRLDISSCGKKMIFPKIK